jgi:hypothetical protein
MIQKYTSCIFYCMTIIIRDFVSFDLGGHAFYNVSKSKIHQHCILPRKYNRQRRQLLFLVCLQVSEKVGL